MDTKLKNDGVSSYKLGTGRYYWEVSPQHVNLAPPREASLIANIAAEKQNVTLDLKRTAIIVVDMQNDFCAPGGWVDYIGGDLTPERAPIPVLQKMLPAFRSLRVPVIWLNWGNRPDRLNLPPTVQFVFNSDGQGLGIGGSLPQGMGKVLEKDSPSASVVKELEQLPEDIQVDKFRISGFWDTELDSILKNLDVKSIFFTGVNTDQCVLHTLVDAHFLGYNCLLVEDGCGTTSPDYCREATIWNIKTCFGFVTDSSRVLEGLEAVVAS